MNQKGFANILLIGVIAILIVVGGYFIFFRETCRLESPPDLYVCGSNFSHFISSFRKPVSVNPTQISNVNTTPTPTPTPTPSPSVTLLPTELKYRLEGKFGKAIFCGPPVEYIGYGDELLKQFPTISANTQEFTIILQHLNIAYDRSWTDQEKLAVVNEHNRLSVISLELSNGNYRFTIRSKSQNKVEFIYEGTITKSGLITTTKQEAYLYGCPICLSGNTLIDTPSGLVAVKNLRVDMPVWTSNKSGHRVSGVVEKTSRVPVPPTHQMVHLILDDGRELFVSSLHPTIDGRTVGDLVINDLYDGARVVSSERVAYGDIATYDILPSGETGFYWANGILLDSTLH